MLLLETVADGVRVGVALALWVRTAGRVEGRRVEGVDDGVVGVGTTDGVGAAEVVGGAGGACVDRAGVDAAETQALAVPSTATRPSRASRDRTRTR